MKKYFFTKEIISDDFRDYLLQQTGVDPYEPDITKRKIWFGYNHETNELIICVDDDINLDIESIVANYQVFNKKKVLIDNLRKTKVADLLSKTDYVIIKLQEAQVLGDETKYQELLEQYNSVLEQRKQIRAWNDDVEKRIQEATTREELETIRQEIASYEPA